LRNLESPRESCHDALSLKKRHDLPRRAHSAMGWGDNLKALAAWQGHAAKKPVASPRGTMAPPKLPDATARAAYRHAETVLVETGEDPSLSRGLITSYALAVSEARRLQREWRKAGARGVQHGPQGGVYQDPLLLAIDRAERRGGDFAAQLGLTPASRRKLGRSVRGGRPFGQAVAADRKVVPIRRTEHERRMAEARDRLGR
jgi:phage terminase small subunit